MYANINNSEHIGMMDSTLKKLWRLVSPQLHKYVFNSYIQ